MSKKILLCVNSDIGRGNTIGFRFGKIAKELKSQGFGFDIIARANYSDEFTVKTPFYGNYLVRFLYALKIYFFSRMDFRSLDVYLFDRFVFRQIKKRGGEYDMAHLGEHLPKTARYLTEKGVKVVLDIPIGHEAYSLWLRERGIKDGDGEVHIYSFMEKSIKLADSLVVPSEFVKETLEIAGWGKKETSIIPFGADAVKDFSKRDIASRLDKSGKIKFLFAGNVNFRKGIRYLLEAWKEINLNNAELIICGRVHKEIRSEIDKIGAKNVRFMGFVNLDEYFRQAHVFVFPSLVEGSAKAVYEAMRYGLPVITTFNAGSIVDDNSSGLIVPIADASVLGEKMKFLYDHSDEIKRMGESAFEKVKDYPWENYAEKVVSLYKKYL